MSAHTPEQIAFIFPGQGSQSVGMGRELASLHPVAQQTFDEADAALGFKLSQVCWEGPDEKLRLTEITQPAILTMSIAVLRVLREKGIAPAITAGHSLGEYSAHVAAGTLEFQDAVRTVHHRGRYMQEAVPVGEGAMAAVLGMPINDLRALCYYVVNSSADGRNDAGSDADLDHVLQKIGDARSGKGQEGIANVDGSLICCQAANINSPDQIVISGSKQAVEGAAELAKQRGAKRAIMLPVSAPFHSALMQPAQDRLAADLKALTFHRMSVPVVSNVDGEVVSDPEKARDALIRQVTGAVRWEECMRLVIGRGIQTFIEVGPGKVLCGLLRQIDRSKTCFNVEDEQSLQKVRHHFTGNKPAAD
ncbi:MAG: ACP S-malonyltransferase [Terriglobales bacterium]